MNRKRSEARPAPVPPGPSALLGKNVLVDVCYAPSADAAGPRRQFYGVVASASERNVVLSLSCGKTIDLPPDPTLYRTASPGPHHLPSTGEVVAQVDLVIAFTTSGPYGAGALTAVTQTGC